MTPTRFITALALVLTLTTTAQAAPKAKAGPAQEIQLYGASHQYSVYALLEDSVPWQFTLDTGAADMLIPWTLFNTLWQARLVGWANMLPDKEYELADGRTVKYMRMRITLTIGTHRLENIDVCIAPKGTPASSLLGVRVLTRFQSFGIDHTRGILRLGSPRQP